MTRFIALVRAANVGGTGTLPMATLTSACEDAGFRAVKTCINSGNVVFTSRLEESGIRRALEKRLELHTGRAATVVVRTADEMAAVLTANPFRQASASRTVAIFLQAPPPADALQRATGRGSEQMALGVRELYIAYGDRMADSRLRLPGIEAGTARNMNTIAKLASLAQGLTR